MLSAGDVRLMVIGYGWADEHINAVIAQGVMAEVMPVPYNARTTEYERIVEEFF
ncbi:MAG: hypothetical protein ABW205_04160 [Burkholderiales bacterium]